MAGVDYRALLGAIATKVATIDGLEGASYPPLNHVPRSPWAMVRQSTTLPSTVGKTRAKQQQVRLAIDVVLLIDSDEKRPGDAARLDALILPVLDLFDANAVGGNVNLAFAGIDIGGSVERIWDETIVRRTPLIWGESGYCHAAILTLDAEYRRTVGG
jgi:hypothetical protein